MMIRAAYIGIVIIWSTTPLAIQWSSEGGGYLFGLTARMVIGLAILYMVFKLLSIKLPRTISAVKVYMVSGLGIYASMFCVYWGAQFIPSGWIAIVFGLSPIVTGLFSMLLCQEKSFNLLRLIGIVSAVLGLTIIFGSSNDMSINTTWGIAAVFVSTITHALSAVIIKRINAPLSGIQSTHGGLLVAVPLFLLSMLLLGESMAVEIPSSAWSAIVYLGVIATALGFSLYYFVLKNLDAIRVSMITLITPVTALLLGAYFNNELLTLSTLFGAGLVVLGLAIFEFDKVLCKILMSSSRHCASLIARD